MRTIPRGSPAPPPGPWAERRKVSVELRWTGVRQEAEGPVSQAASLSLVLTAQTSVRAPQTEKQWHLGEDVVTPRVRWDRTWVHLPAFSVCSTPRSGRIASRSSTGRTRGLTGQVRARGWIERTLDQGPDGTVSVDATS